MGTFLSGFTAFFNPIVDEFGWSYTLVSLATSIRHLETGLASPLVGILVDKYHPRKILFAGVISGALGFYAFSKVNSLWSFYASFLLIGVSTSLTSHVVVNTAIVTWFKKRTAVVIGIFTALTGVVGFIVPLTVLLVDRLGWRDTMAYFALGTLVICIPFCLLVKDPPQKSEDVTPATLLAGQDLTGRSLTAKEILKQKNFWLLSLALLFVALASSAIHVHQIPYLVSVQVPRETAGWLAVVVSLSALGGGLGFGWLAEVLDKRICFALAALAQVLGLVGFAYGTTTVQFVASLAAIGIGTGGVNPLRAVLQLEFFGLRAFATVLGLAMVLSMLGTTVSPLLVGGVYDWLKNYQPAWLILAAMTLVAVPLILGTTKKSL